MEETSLREVARGPVRRKPRATIASKPPVAAAPPGDVWVSSLAPCDLACLLQVIEGQLLPQLIGAYRPSDGAPLKSSRGR